MPCSIANLPSRLLPLLLLLSPSTALAGSLRSRSAGRPSPGCDQPTTLAPNSRTNFTLPTSDALGNNGGRPYMLWVPPSYNSSSSPKTPVPLIISLHGASRTAAWQAELDRLSDVGAGFNADHAVAYAQSTGSNAADRFWEGFPGLADDVDDVAYVLAVLDAVADRHLCVDLSRVYVSGKSQGGGLAAQVLACDTRSSGRFAAFASVSGAYYVPPSSVVGDAQEEEQASCDPETVPLPPCDPGREKVPVLAFHGGNDTTIAIGGGERRGFCLPDVRRWVEGWAGRNGLDEAPVEVRNLTGDATAFVYGRGEGSGEEDRGLVTFVYDGDRVGHDWPATFPNSDSVAHGTDPASFNASSIIMEYFRNYSLPDAETTSTPTSTPSSTNPTGTPASTSVVEQGAATMSIPLGTSGQLAVAVAFIGLAWNLLYSHQL